ncbi:MAG: 3-hydroxyacyl-CoA dehydrogenase family protein [Bacteroidetes bacterium]|nr:3-hydroxyacyl-CoA dehydrogenase family protein [Bacteroidota bacterium]MBU1578216.1 3-hydroxyacyl-CoA dehydrogenase family protein [Bacteroidota bacterium]MBU2558191.1 3-hydroxyacyl-CoA dehydrogenase family protein [Bacteroidota bacterium]
MTYDERLQQVAVLGAAGKMGSGILLLTAVEMADISLKPENKGKTFVLNAIDLSDEGLAGLMDYLRAQVLKIAEKKTIQLRQLYADRTDLIENYDIIDQYVNDVLKLVRPTTAMETAYHANLVFEAVTENKALKVKILKQIDEHNPNKPWVFTNTSSVPIHLIESEAGLNGRVLGFHFYNPPAVQKLVELIVTKSTDPQMNQFALDYAKALRKVVVPSNDIAGFIGNGHFMRDAIYGINQALELAGDRPLPEAIYMVNKVSQDFLVRPMGIFQLIDYVGIDVVQFIMKVMNPHMQDEDLHSDLLDQMIALSVKGGQMSSGAQKDGFLKYEKGFITAVYDPTQKAYISLESFSGKCDQKLGELPENYKPWKAAVRIADKDSHFIPYFEAMKLSDGFGAKLAVKYGKNSDAIGRKLVSDGVANNHNDVNTVMLTGFFHAYGPVNNYFA